MMELAGSKENHAKANPERESGNNRIFKASLPDASPHWNKNLLMCSIVVILCCPENLEKSGTVSMRQSNLIISFRVRSSIHISWLFGLQAKLISDHIGYFAGPINVLEATILLLDHLLRLLHQWLRLVYHVRLNRYY
jgi:hypothetical protein